MFRCCSLEKSHPRLCFPVCVLVSFVLNCIYKFWFPLFAGSIYCTLFLLDCFDFAYGYICICVYSVTLFIVVINLCLFVGLLQFYGVFLFLFLLSFFIILIFFNLLHFFYIYSLVCFPTVLFPL